MTPYASRPQCERTELENTICKRLGAVVQCSVRGPATAITPSDTTGPRDHTGARPDSQTLRTRHAACTG